MLTLKNIKLLLAGFVALVSLVGIVQPARINAQTPLTTFGEVNAAPVKKDCNDPAVNSGNCAIIKRLIDLIKVLSALVGVVVVIMITVGGIQYSASRDNPQAMAAAKGRIINAIIALVIYLFMFAFLQYMVPGGVL